MEKKIKSGVCDMIKKSDRLMIFPEAITNCNWLIVAAHVPVSLRRKAEKHGSEDIAPYLAPVQEIISQGISAASSLPQARVITAKSGDGYAYLGIEGSEKFACFNVKYLAYFQKALGVDTFYHNRWSDMVICYRSDVFVGVIMEVRQ
jgi:hypothetical protein